MSSGYSCSSQKQCEEQRQLNTSVSSAWGYPHSTSPVNTFENIWTQSTALTQMMKKWNAHLTQSVSVKAWKCMDSVQIVLCMWVKPASSNCYSTNKCDFIPQDRTKVCVHLRSTSPGVWRKFGVEIFLKNELNLRKTPTEVQVSSFICHIHDYTEIV